MNSDDIAAYFSKRPALKQQGPTDEDLQIELDLPRVGPQGGRLPPRVESDVQRARGGGQPLKTSLQEQMGAALGYDFSGVRVHTGADADRLNRELRSRAFTIGSDVFFERGAYDPDSASGKELIAHELVHVAQQSAGRVSGEHDVMTVTPASSALEREADALARWAVTGRAEEGTRPCEMTRDATRSSHAPAAFGAAPTIIQRTINSFVAAAATRPPTTAKPAQGRMGYAPSNCHEGVLGWLITSVPKNRAWQLLAVIRERLSHRHGHESQIWYWLKTHIYTPALPVSRNLLGNVQRGDILFTIEAGALQHSMVVVAGAPNTQIRAVNNRGTFGAGGLHPVPAGQVWDPYERDITLAPLWHRSSTVAFNCNGAGCTYPGGVAHYFGFDHLVAKHIYRVTYANAVANLNSAIDECWSHSRMTRGQGWSHHAPATGCPPGCPY